MNSVNVWKCGSPFVAGAQPLILCFSALRAEHLQSYHYVSSSMCRDFSLFMLSLEYESITCVRDIVEFLQMKSEIPIPDVVVMS